MIKTVKGNEIKVQIDSWGELLEILGQKDFKMPGKYTGYTARTDYEAQTFTGTKSMEEAHAFARLGIPEIAEKIKRVSAESFDHVSGIIETYNPGYDLEGISVDVGRFLSGEPECFLKFESTHQAGHGKKLIRVGYSVSAPCNIKASELQQAGIIAAALVELLEFAGFNVSFTTYYRAGYDKEIVAIVPVKPMGQPLDLQRLSFVAHPSYLRRFTFGLAERVLDADEIKGTGSYDRGGHGHQYPLSSDDMKDIDILIDPKIGMGGGNPVPFLIRQLEAQGVKIKQGVA